MFFSHGGLLVESSAMRSPNESVPMLPFSTDPGRGDSHGPGWRPGARRSDRGAGGVAQPRSRCFFHAQRTTYGLLNHGEIPNCVVDDRTIRTTRQVDAGEELLLAYRFIPCWPIRFFARLLDFMHGWQSGRMHRIATPESSPVRLRPRAPFYFFAAWRNR